MRKILFASLLFSFRTCAYTPSYAVGKACYDRIKPSLPSDFSVVKAGGWAKVYRDAAVSVGKARFDRTKSALPKDFSPVPEGGWDACYAMAADPKAELVALIGNKLRASNKVSAEQDATVETLVSLLHALGKGFESEKADGEWAIVLARQGKESVRVQRLVESKEKAQTAFSNFDINEMKFLNLNYLFRGLGILRATVKYAPSSEAFTMSAEGKVVLRRISCDIVGADWKFWKLPRVPLPLRAKGGYLDFVYMDNDIRITKGNRGGLFIHFRPDYLKTILS